MSRHKIEETRSKSRCKQDLPEDVLSGMSVPRNSSHGGKEEGRLQNCLAAYVASRSPDKNRKMEEMKIN